jgi:hypothetical protein
VKDATSVAYCALQHGEQDFMWRCPTGFEVIPRYSTAKKTSPHCGHKDCYGHAGPNEKDVKCLCRHQRQSRLYFKEAGSGTPIIFPWVTADHNWGADASFYRGHRIAYSARTPSDVPSSDIYATSITPTHWRARSFDNREDISSACRWDPILRFRSA